MPTKEQLDELEAARLRLQKAIEDNLLLPIFKHIINPALFTIRRMLRGR